MEEHCAQRLKDLSENGGIQAATDLVEVDLADGSEN
jgi:hypothetical protein